MAAVLLDGLSYRRAGRMVGISKTEVGDSMDLLLDALAALGYCQPDGTFITTLADLGELLAELALAGEAVVVDGLATRVQRPSGWTNQKVLYDAKRHTHTAQGLAVSCRCRIPSSMPLTCGFAWVAEVREDHSSWRYGCCTSSSVSSPVGSHCWPAGRRPRTPRSSCCDTRWRSCADR